MEKIKLNKGDIVQLSPDHKFACDLIVVTEPKEWGCQGFLASPYLIDGLTRYKGRAFLRVKFEEFELVGKCAWMSEEDLKDEE